MQLDLGNKPLWLKKSPVDFRCAINGLSEIVISEMGANPMENLFIFYNKKRDKLKCLFWHKNGFVMLYKRLEKGKFHFSFNSKTGKAKINETELGWLLAGLDWQMMGQWQELNYDKFS